MAEMRVTCPESGHLETIEIERRGRFLVALRCSSFGGCFLDCEQTCARRLTTRYAGHKLLGPGTLLLTRSCMKR
ncbi:MAG: hypothetical protein JNL83_30690 [Myxococcales bacterium]|nr:hypothetical protein [Myxococcales bacterium]